MPDPDERGLPDLTPLIGPVAAIETVRQRPVGPVAFEHAKLVHIMGGSARVHTAAESRIVMPGDVLVLGRRVWSQAVPLPWVRAFTIYLQEKFLRLHIGWAIPAGVRLRQGVPPQTWDGQALFLRPGIEVLERMEPVLRQMSVIPAAERVAGVAELMALFARTVEIIVPTLVDETTGAAPDVPGGSVAPLVGPPLSAPVAEAVMALRSHLARAWTVTELAKLVALSESQLTRRFTTELGVTPMRWLTEARLTEFARLVEETTQPLSAAAAMVGWVDARVAAVWFRRRYGTSPSQHRSTPPAPSLSGWCETPRVLWGECRTGGELRNRVGRIKCRAG